MNEWNTTVASNFNSSNDVIISSSRKSIIHNVLTFKAYIHIQRFLPAWRKNWHITFTIQLFCRRKWLKLIRSNVHFWHEKLHATNFNLKNFHFNHLTADGCPAVIKGSFFFQSRKWIQKMSVIEFVWMKYDRMNGSKKNVPRRWCNKSAWG